MYSIGTPGSKPGTAPHPKPNPKKDTSHKMSGFKAASAPKLPKIACIGEISSVADTKASQSGAYNVTTIKIEPRGGGFGTTFSLLTRPEWLTPGFSPDVDLEGNNSALFVYRTNIAGPSGSAVGRIQGITGSEENASALAAELYSAATTVKDEDGNEHQVCPDAALDAAIRKFVGTTVGYVLQQRMEDTGEVDENGRKVKVRTNNYELGDLFFPSPKALDKYRKLASERPEDWRVGFDEAF